MLLPHIHIYLTNLFISSHKGYYYQIWGVKTTPCYKSIGNFSTGGTNVMTLINLYISSYRKATGATFVYTNT